jgi:uncharacterized protein (TIGR02246 family)
MNQVLETPATTKIEGFVHAVIDAWNRHDMRAYAACFTQDADFVNVVGMHWRGRPEIEACHIRLHETVFRDTSLRTLEWTVRFLGPEVGLVHISWEMTGAVGTENWQVPKVRHGVMTLVLVPAAEAEFGWLATSAHNTEVVPLSMSELDGK